MAPDGALAARRAAGDALMRSRGLIWPALVVAALLFTVGVNVVMLFAAAGDHNGSVVEPDYYRKAVEWDRTMARRAESARLGWRASVELGALLTSTDAGSGASRPLVLTLRDSSGAAVEGADVLVTLIHNSDAAHPVGGALRATAPGRYELALAAAPSGRWEVRVEARRAADRFGSTLHVEAP